MDEAPQDISLSTDPGELFDSGGVALRSKDYLEAMKFFRPAAAQGHVGAQNQIGFLYMFGFGVKQDYAEAVKWFRTAADQGFAAAQDHLGQMHKSGSGVNRDPAEAMKWFRKAADQGFSAAQYNIALLYHNGIGVESDLAEAANWYRKAADQGLHLAQNSLAMCYLQGWGVKTDSVLAVAWFRKAAEQSLAMAEHNLGSLFQNGWGCKQDYGEALKWYLKAATQDFLRAQDSVGWFYVMGWGVQQDYHAAMNWFRRAAESEYPPAQYNIGFLYQNGFGVSQNLSEAISWYRKAADARFSPAEQLLKRLAADVSEGTPAVTISRRSLQAEERPKGRIAAVFSSSYKKAAAWYQKTTGQGFWPGKGWRVLVPFGKREASIAIGGVRKPDIEKSVSKQPSGELIPLSQKVIVQVLPEPRQASTVLIPSFTDDATAITIIPPGPRMEGGPPEKMVHNRGRKLPVRPLTFNVGDLIQGMFRVESVLNGGMGVVYICRRIRPAEMPELAASPTCTGEPGDQSPLQYLTTEYLAVKTIRPELLGHSDVVSRFEYEAYVWISLLPHPNLVRAGTFFTASGIMRAFEGNPLLHLEYVDGGNLRSRLHCGQLSEQEVLRVSMQVCDGMHFLYESARIVHRDIKPENILFTSAGHAKVTDFGLAKALLLLPKKERRETSKEGVESTQELTRYGVILGTLPYMSPEQFASPHEATVASDVYSFGVVLYEMVTGHLPFTATGFVEWQRKHLHETPTSPSSFADVPGGLSSIAMKCLRKSEAHRFRDFAELRGALESYCHSSGRSGLISPPVRGAELEAKMTAEDWTLRGFALGQLGDDSNSLQSYMRAMESDPTYPGLNCNLATVLARLGRHEEALLHYQREIELQPKLPTARVLLGEAYLSAGRNEEGLAAIRIASQLDAGDITVWEHYALALRAIGSSGEDYRHAIAKVKELLNSARYNDVGSAIHAAVFFGQIAHVDVAMDLHILTVKKFPQNATCWYNFGVAAHRIANFEGALKLYSSAIDRDNRLTLAFVNRGLVHAVRGDRL